MAAYIVAYDLRGTDVTPENYERLGEAIEALGEARELQRSVWVLDANRQAPDIFDALWQHLSEGDRLLVVRATAPATLQSPHAEWVGAILRA